jgi:hypothetical protein
MGLILHTKYSNIPEHGVFVLGFGKFNLFLLLDGHLAGSLKSSTGKMPMLHDAKLSF